VCSLDKHRAVGQPKVVVGAEIQDVVARLDRDVGALGRCDHALGFVESGVSDRLDFGFEVLQEGAGHGSVLDVVRKIVSPKIRHYGDCRYSDLINAVSFFVRRS